MIIYCNDVMMIYLDVFVSFVLLPATVRKGWMSTLLAYNADDIPFRSKPWESSITLFPDVARMLAISRAASSLRNSRKPLFCRIASPINSALLASPCARRIIDYRQIRSVLYIALATNQFLLDCLVHQESGTERSLLSDLFSVRRRDKLRVDRTTNLFCFHRMREFRREGYMSNWHVVQHKTEFQGTIGQTISDKLRHLEKKD